jgi:hypothetical protein
MKVAIGMLLVVGGFAAVASALPATHHLARVMPQWAFSRGDTERLASATFLIAFVGLLGVVAGVALLLLAAVQQ